MECLTSVKLTENGLLPPKPWQTLSTEELGRILDSLLFEVSSRDPLTYLAGAALIAAVSLLACLLPARRATQVDPMLALRYE